MGGFRGWMAGEKVIEEKKEKGKEQKYKPNCVPNIWEMVIYYKRLLSLVPNTRPLQYLKTLTSRLSMLNLLSKIVVKSIWPFDPVSFLFSCFIWRKLSAPLSLIAKTTARSITVCVVYCIPYMLISVSLPCPGCDLFKMLDFSLAPKRKTAVSPRWPVFMCLQCRSHRQIFCHCLLKLLQKWFNMIVVSSAGTENKYLVKILESPWSRLKDASVDCW